MKMPGFTAENSLGQNFSYRAATIVEFSNASQVIWPMQADCGVDCPNGSSCSVTCPPGSSCIAKCNKQGSAVCKCGTAKAPLLE